jgi:hypothetical protein
MAKKDKQAKKDKAGGGAADAVDAIRSAIERGLEGAGLTEKRQREVVDQVTSAAGRIRQTLEDLRVVDEVKDLRSQVDRLAARVGELEGAARTRATSAGSSRSTASRSSSTGTRSTGTRSTGTRAKSSSTRAKSSGTSSRAKSSGTGSARSTSSRASSSRAKPKSTGS